MITFVVPAYKPVPPPADAPSPGTGWVTNPAIGTVVCTMCSRALNAGDGVTMPDGQDPNDSSTWTVAPVHVVCPPPPY